MHRSPFHDHKQLADSVAGSSATPGLPRSCWATRLRGRLRRRRVVAASRSDSDKASGCIVVTHDPDDIHRVAAGHANVAVFEV